MHANISLEAKKIGGNFREPESQCLNSAKNPVSKLLLDHFKESDRCSLQVNADAHVKHCLPKMVLRDLC